MSAGLPPILGCIDGIPASELLDGLSNLHQSVVVTNPDGVVLWASRDLDHAVARCGRPADLALAKVCEGYLLELNDVAQGLGCEGTDPPAVEAPDIEHQTAGILDHLAHSQSLTHYRIEASTPGRRASNDPIGRDAATCAGIEINAFRVDSCMTDCGRPGDAGHNGESSHNEHLYVTILRPTRNLEVAQAPLSNSASFYESVLEQLPEATLTLDTFGFITYANVAALDLLGKTADDLINTPVSFHLPSSAIVEADAALDLDTTEAKRSVLEFSPAERPPRFVEVTSRSLETSDGARAGRILQLRDTTREQNVTERLKQKVASLETYVHTVSHDLRSPLVSLLGFTRLMKNDFGEILGETGRKFLDRIEQAGSNMNNLTRDLLELSTRKQPSICRETVDPLNVLRQIRAEVKPRLEEYGIELRLPVAPSMIQCDYTQLYQVFSNLIVNAIQHMGPCSEPRIEIKIQELPNQRIIVVRDNGRGIETSSHDQIFDPFHSLSRDDGESSTGVGLAIVKKIALSHEGRVWVESQPGHGAAFFVSLKHR